MQHYRLFMGNNHTSQALPCLKTKHSAANSTIKYQHALLIMRDFITLDESHTGMRYNQQVIQHTLYFLQTGAFLPPTQRTTALY
ncbi:hypothetical protein [Pseudoalteromonas agarivorans]|uniref:hypothetical protein n=1 Tax=Pseudoalteromonas agarivorans TaxID=176102 RepID=UPI0013CE5CFE|nr:hypothetical protein [Pseudoalteromonas agarivorans]